AGQRCGRLGWTAQLRDESETGLQGKLLLANRDVDPARHDLGLCRALIGVQADAELRASRGRRDDWRLDLILRRPTERRYDVILDSAAAHPDTRPRGASQRIDSHFVQDDTAPLIDKQERAVNQPQKDGRLWAGLD